MRLARFLAAAGVASRRAAEEFIRSGRVQVNGKTITTPAYNVVPERDTVSCDGRPLRPAPSCVLLVNKPRGVTCSLKDAHAERLLSDILPRRFGRLFPVGRLDRDSEGALLCTNDGDLADRLMHPRYGVEKTYRVQVRGALPPGFCRTLEQGIRDEGELLRAVRARVLERLPDGAVLELVLREGRKREIRRMCRRSGLRVVRLVRVAIGPIRLGPLRPGQWRLLEPAEVAQLQGAGKGNAGPVDTDRRS